MAIPLRFETKKKRKIYQYYGSKKTKRKLTRGWKEKIETCLKIDQFFVPSTHYMYRRYENDAKQTLI